MREDSCTRRRDAVAGEAELLEPGVLLQGVRELPAPLPAARRFAMRTEAQPLWQPMGGDGPLFS